MTPSRALLIYDGDCAYCRGFSRLLSHLDRTGQLVQLPFDATDAQELLRAQFGDATGFAMYLVEADRIHWGARAAERVTALLAAPMWLSKLALRSYPTVVSLVSRLSRRRRTVCGPGCAMDAPTGARDQGTAALTHAARDVFAQLTRADASAPTSSHART